MNRRCLVPALLLTTACGGALASGAHDATQSAVLTLDSAPDKQALDDLAASAGTAAGTAFRDVALSPETTRQLNVLVAAVGDKLRADLLTTREVQQLRDALLAGLDVQVRALVHAAFDQATADAPGLVQAVRPALVADTAAVVDSGAARVEAALAQERAQAAADLSRWRWLAICGAVAVALLFALHVRRELLDRRKST